MEQNAPDRHACTSDGCGKSFIRKEHLTRHALSHTAAPSYICHICQRAFTRNDVLQRHIIRHTAAVETTERNKRACQACHKAKTRCAGGMPCQSCVKRGIQCSFDGAAEGQERFDNEVLPRGTQNPALPEVNRQIIQSFQAQNLVVSDAMDVDGAGPGLGMTQTLPAFETFDQANSAPTIPVPPSNVSPRLRLNSGFLKRAHQHPIDAEAGELYFTHFHPRWPIIHIASYDEDAVGLQTLNYSVMMVGVWLNGTTISQDEAVAMHIRLMDKLFPRLTVSWRPANVEDPKTWPLFQSSLLNIIFAFYTGDNELISPAIMMLNALVGVLREIGLFRPETWLPKFKANGFGPYIMVLIERRKRLAVALFRIDAYIAMFRSQPPLLRSEEMHFILPNTYSFWNQKTIHSFDSFSAAEPIERSQTTILDLMHSPFQGKRLSPFVTFPEDIQMGICSMQSSIWELIEKARDSDVDDATIATFRQVLVKQLDYWKTELDEFSTYDLGDPAAAEARSPRAVPDRYYWGLEDHAQPGWEDVVLARPGGILFDTTQLYHLLSIHIHSDVRNLCRLARHPDAAAAAAAIKWASTACARHALLHAAAILKANKADAYRFGGVVAEPLTLMALYVGALVVWAYARFGLGDCAGEHGAGPAWPELDAKWVEMWGWASMDGLPLCRCVAGELVKRFAVFLPAGLEGWGGYIAKVLRS